MISEPIIHTSREPIERDVLVIGGGQAALAMGWSLARQGRDFTILDAAPESAAAWRSRWDGLELFTPARHSSLPGRALPGDPDHHPTRDEVVGYLTDYARHFELPVEHDSRVRALRKVDGRYRAELDDRTYEARQVVVATGPFQTPRRPASLAAALDPRVVQLHSSEYRRPGDVPRGSVLVVGGGNSGHQIAAELAADPGRQVHLSVGSRQTALPARVLGRDLFDVLQAAGLMDQSVGGRIGRRLKGRETLVGSSTRRATRAGIAVEGRAVSASGATVAFADGTGLTVDAVVWATGFGTDRGWIDVPVFDAAGDVVHRRGVTMSEGLCFLGLPWLHTRGSALLGWVGDDAEHLAAHLGSRAPRLRRGGVTASTPRRAGLA